MSGVSGFALIRRLRPALAYATVAVLTVALFIALHFVGNRLPYELAVHRLAEEFRAAADKEDYGVRGGVSWDQMHYCEYSSGVLGGARATRDGGGGLRDAILLRSFRGWSRKCPVLKAAVFEGVFRHPSYMNVRHWMGGKALYAIALHRLTVRQFHVVIKALIYCGFLALALALALIGWRALLVGAPLLTFGLFFSAVDQHSNIADGLPFAWALFAATFGAVLSKRGPMSAARLFLFFAGMVSHFLWLFDGGNFVAATLIGVVVWLAREQDPPRQRVGRAAACVGVYTAGFAASLAARAVIAGSLLAREQVAGKFVARAEDLLQRMWAPQGTDLVVRDPGAYQELVRMDTPTFAWLLPTAAAALVLAVLIAGYRAWRGSPAVLLGVLWVALLFLPPVVHFLSPADMPARAPRLMFLPLGLAWCCLLVTLTGLSRRQAAAWAGGVGAALALSWGGTHLASAWHYEAKLTRARALSTAQEDGAFAVYLLDAAAGEDGAAPGRPDATPERELIYRRSPCSTQEFRARFFLHFLAPVGDLPEAREKATPNLWRQLGFVNADFTAYQRGQIFLGTCYASVRLPDYATAIRTGQTFYLGGGDYRALWSLESDLPRDVREAK